MRESSAKPLSPKARAQGKDYLRKVLKLYTTGAVEPGKQRHVKNVAGIKHTRYHSRKRRLFKQGRPQNAFLVREETWRWFSNVKRSISSRISPKAILLRARALLEVYVTANLKAGKRADAPVIDYGWLRGWRHEYNVSFGNQTRNGKYRVRCCLSD